MAKKHLEFLVIEDDELSRLSLTTMLKDHGSVTEAPSAKEAKALLATKEFDLAFIDLDLEEDLIGLDLIDLVVANKAYAVVLSGRQEDECIEEAYTRGCQDYLNKPFAKEALELVMKKFNFLQGQGKLSKFFAHEYVTQDKELVDQLQILNEVVVSDKPVFIGGATGTGKTLIAKHIHELIHGEKNSFIHLNCSEIPENLMESELFGYEKGAFSGAENSKRGKLELADGGTLFLDEIATMPMLLQQKLLKAIDEKTFYPLGSEKPVQANFRLISATCENLKGKVANNEFREDLYYRIDGFNINLKPLKDRKDDIPLLIKHFMRLGHRRVVINKEAMGLMLGHEWRGNIRELRRTVEILQTRASGLITPEDLPESVRGATPAKVSKAKPSVDIAATESVEGKVLNASQMQFIADNGLKVFLEVLEDEVVEHFYKENNEKVRQTLSTLKISNSSFYRIMDRIKGKKK